MSCTLFLPLARANDVQWVIDTYARVVVSKFSDVTKKPPNEISTYLCRVSLGEVLRKFVYFMI